MMSTGVDCQGSIILRYNDFDGIIVHSKVSNSYLPSEIQGENGSIIINKINTFSEVKIYYKDGSVEDISLDHCENDMYYEIKEFVDLILSNRSSSNLNTLETSLEVICVMDKIRNCIGLVFPADNK